MNLIFSIQLRDQFLLLWGAGRGIVNFGMSRKNQGATSPLQSWDMGTARSSSARP